MDHPTSSSPSPSPASWIPETGSDAVQPLAETWLFRLVRERFRSRLSGRSHDFFVMHLADAVSVVALTPDRYVILVRQFRAGSRRESLEPPGGLLESGEDPTTAAARELLEETGYAGDRARVLGVVWSNPSLLTSRTITVLIPNVRKVADPRPDPGEELVIERVHARQIPKLIAEGKIDHALAVQALLLWLTGELQGHALSLPPELAMPVMRPWWRRQYRIGSFMTLIVLVALGLGVMRMIGIYGDLLVGYMTAVCALGWAIFASQDPRRRPVLMRAAKPSLSRIVIHVLALGGLSALFWGAVRLAGLA